MWIKICANTNLEDAQLAADLGADALGFVFARSKRQVTPRQVASISSHLPSQIEKVGVFDSQDPEEIAEAVVTAGLDAVQLHGDLNEDLLRALHARLAASVRIIQTLHWQVGDDAASTEVAEDFVKARQGGIVDRILIDSKVGGASGGTGIAFDWSVARGLFARSPELPLILAGGLTSENVAEAIVRLQPWGIDVASGVEAEPGRKHPARLARFIQQARKSAAA